MINKIHTGDALELMAKISDKSVDCIITSPPYWQLRDYGYPEQWGLESTFEEYLHHLWLLMDESRRVLKDSGTAWINLGDTYGTTSGNIKQGNTEGKIKYTGKIEGYNKPEGLHKCLLLIPHRFAIGCIDRGWVMRNDIIWGKRNGMPESVIDRFSKKHEYVFFMAKNLKYYFDIDGIRDKLQNPVQIRNKASEIYGTGSGYKKFSEGTRQWGNEKKGKNPGTVSDFWDITLKGNKEEHYASFNFKLIEKPIIAGSPEGGIVLDPFCGTGTTLVRALQLNRKVIGIDGSKDYCKIAQRNIDVELQQLKMF